MAEQKKQLMSTPDTPVTGLSQTGNAVDLARLLRHECGRLLQLYKEKETLPDQTPDAGRIVSLSPDSRQPSTAQKVQLLHSALRQCLGLIHRVIQKEKEEWGELEGDYETMKKNVQLRLENLLSVTKSLVETKSVTLEVTPDHQCNQETDGAGGGLALKMWTYRVLLELVHWADHAEETLNVLHTEKQQ